MVNKSYSDPDKELSFIYPSNWDVEWDAEVISVYNPDGVGALQFSSYRFNDAGKNVDLKSELQTMLNNQQVKGQIKEDDNYVKAEFFDQEGKYWKYWLFLKKGVLIFASYNCDKEDMSKEDKEINEILGSAMN